MPPPLPTSLSRGSSEPERERVLLKRNLQDILQGIDPLGQLDDEVEEVCLRFRYFYLWCVINFMLVIRCRLHCTLYCNLYIVDTVILAHNVTVAGSPTARG